MNENMKYSLHYKKYEINSLRQFIKLHAVYLGQPSFRYSLSLNCGLYNHSQINQRCVRYLYKQRDVCKIRMYFKYETNSIFHESNACLPRGVLGDKITRPAINSMIARRLRPL